MSELIANFDVQVEINEEFAASVEADEVLKAAQAALLAEGLSGQTIGVSIEVAGDEYVQRLNREYRGVDRTTDVLSFANEEAPDWEGRPCVVYQLETTNPTYGFADDDEIVDDTDEDDFEGYEDEADDGPGAFRFVTPPELAAQQNPDDRYLGDIVVSYPQAERQAAEFHNTPRREVQELVIHGIFHLLGYDHEEADDKEIMRAKEEAAALRLDEAKQA